MNIRRFINQCEFYLVSSRFEIKQVCLVSVISCITTNMVKVNLFVMRNSLTLLIINLKKSTYFVSHALNAVNNMCGRFSYSGLGRPSRNCIGLCAFSHLPNHLFTYMKVGQDAKSQKISHRLKNIHVYE